MRYALDINHAERERINALHNPAEGRYVAPLTPMPRTVSDLARDIARAVGKRQDRYGWIGAGQRNWELLQSWIIGDQVRELIVPAAQLLRNRKGWDYLADLARLSQIEVTLILQGTAPSETQLRAINDHHVTPITLDDLFAEHSDERTSGSDLRERGAVDELPEIPFGDPFQLAADLGTEADAPLAWSYFHELREVACDEFTTFARRTFERESYVFLRAWLECATSRNDTLLRLRAAQSALFERRWLLRSDDARVVAFAATARNAALDRETSRQLREYLRTSHACAAAIRLLTRARPAAIVGLRLCDIAEDGSTVTLNGTAWQVPEWARGILRAHLVRRATEGANPDDRLLLAQPKNKHATPVQPLGERGLDLILARMQRETGLPLTGDLDAAPGDDPTDRQLRDWAARVGLTLKALTPIAHERFLATNGS